jgi:hypothetical protein
MEKVSILNIVACKNGWAVYGHHRNENCMPLIDYVFNDAEALGRAVINLVTDGTISGPSKSLALKSDTGSPGSGLYILFHPDGHDLYFEVRPGGAIWRWEKITVMDDRNRCENHMATWTNWDQFRSNVDADFQKACAEKGNLLPYPTFARL